MIASIAHKGLKMLYEHGLGRKLPPVHIKKIARVIDMLESVSSEDDILALGNGVHRLKGEYEGFWALSISGNYRIIFSFL